MRTERDPDNSAVLLVLNVEVMVEAEYSFPALSLDGLLRESFYGRNCISSIFKFFTYSIRPVTTTTTTTAAAAAAFCRY